METLLIHKNGMGDTFITSEAEMDARSEGDEWNWRTDDDANPTVDFTADWVAEHLDIESDVAQRIVDTLTAKWQDKGFFEVTKKQWVALVSEHEASITTAFEAFMADEKAVEQAIDDSTSAAHGGGSYKLELFPDGIYRVLSSNQIGNLYNTPGILISIPALREADMAPIDDDGNEMASAFYDNAIEELRRNFEYAVSES